MITTPKMYGVQCDNCKEDFMGHNDYVAMNEPSGLVDEALDSGWYSPESNRDKHYCPKCHRIEQDDDGEDFPIINANRTKREKSE